jgi:hypothetical protein
MRVLLQITPSRMSLRCHCKCDVERLICKCKDFTYDRQLPVPLAKILFPTLKTTLRGTLRKAPGTSSRPVYSSAPYATARQNLLLKIDNAEKRCMARFMKPANDRTDPDAANAAGEEDEAEGEEQSRDGKRKRAARAADKPPAASQEKRVRA